METEIFKNVKAIHRKQTKLNSDCAKWSFSLLDMCYSLIFIFIMCLLSLIHIYLIILYFKISS